MSLKPKVAHVVSDQIPTVFNDSYLHQFLVAYYQFLEQSGVDGALHYLRNAIEIKDIDTAPDHIVKQVVYSLLNNYKQLNVDPRLLVKNLKQIFSNKGNEKSYKFLMQALFGEEAALKWGRDEVLKASSFKYEQRVVVIVKVPDIDTDGKQFRLDGNILYKEKTATTSHATAVVDNTAVVYKNNQAYLRLDLVPHTVHGNFYVDDFIQCECLNNGKFTTRIVGQHGNLEIQNSGALYKVGDKIRFAGHDGDGYVTETTTGSIDAVHVIDPGLGYTKNDSLIIDHGLGQGFSCVIDTIDGTGATAKPWMQLEEIYIEDGGYNYQVGDEITVNCGDSFTCSVTAVSTSNVVERVQVKNVGFGYTGTRIALYNETNGVYSNVQFIKENLTQLTGVTQLSKQYALDANGKAAVNGIGGDVWISNIVGGAVTEINTSSGINYVNPIISVSKTSPTLQTKISLTANYGIDAVTITKSATSFTTDSDTVDIGTGNKFFVATNPEKYKIGYSVKLGTWNAKVIGISGSTISVNVAATETNAIAALTIYPYVLTLKESCGAGAEIVPVYNGGKVTAVSLPVFITDKIDPVKSSGGSGVGLNVQPFFNVNRIEVTNPGTQYAESILRYDTISVTGGSGSFATSNETLYEVGARLVFGTNICNVTSVVGHTVSFTPNAGVDDYTGPVSIRVFKPATDVIIADGHGSGARFNFVVDNGVIASVNVTAGGTGYTWAQIKDDVNNVGSGAKLVPTINSAGAVVSVAVLDGGHDYAPGDFFVVEGDGSGATILAAGVTINDEAIRRVIVLDGGTGYYNDSKLFVEHIGFQVGTPADLDVVLYPEDSENAGRIQAITVVSGGTGYDADNITLYIDGDGYDARATATVVGGVITNVTVTDPGFAYTSATVNVVRGTNAQFKVNVKDGIISSIDVLNPGSGYGEDSPDYHILPDTNWMPPEPGIMEYMFPVVDHYRLFPEPIGKSRVATATCSVSKGSVKGATINHPGEGYYHYSNPMTVSVVGNGSGARLFPVIDIYALDEFNNPIRRIKDIKILNQGSGYDDATQIVVSRGSCPAGTDAQLTPVIVDGRIVDVIIDEPGEHYFTGTSAFVKGNGLDATITVDIDSGINSIAYESNTWSYAGANPLVVIQDDRGTGADIEAVWNGDFLVGFNINNPGSNYISPVITIGDPDTSGRKFLPAEFGKVKNINVVNGGFGYTNADIVILCDSGFGAIATAEFSSLREIESVTVQSSGFRYGKLPTVSFIDNSKAGRISKVKIIDSGVGYPKLPRITTASATATQNALIVPFGENIGGVSKIQLTDFGVDVDSETIVGGSLNVINREINRYILGEPVFNTDYHYTEDDKSDGPTGLLTEIDHSIAYLKVKLPPILVTLQTENGDTLFGDDGELMIESSDDFGNNWKTLYSQTTLDPMINNRFIGKYKPTAIAYHAPKLVESNSILNTNIRICNSKNIQDYAYTVKTGVDINFWRDIVKQMLHPAGYGMYGQIVDQNFIKRSVKEVAKDESGIIQDIIWLFINLSDYDSMAKVPMDYLYKYWTIEWNNYVQNIPNASEYVSVVHNILFDLTQQYSTYKTIEWNNDISQNNHKFDSMSSRGFRAWYPYEGFTDLVYPDGYVVPASYWSNANTSINHFKDMTIQEYVTSTEKTNLQQDSFILVKTVV